MADSNPLSARQGGWVLVVPPVKRHAADEMWAGWVEQHGRPADDEIRMDILHTSAGDRVRYLVRRGPRTNHGHPHAWLDAGYSTSEIAAAAIARGWPPVQIIKFLKTEMGVLIGDAKTLVDQQLPADVQLANAQMRAVADFSPRISPAATNEDIERLESQTNISMKLRALVAAERHGEVDSVIERFDEEATSFAELSQLEARALVEQLVERLRTEVDLAVSDGNEYEFGWIFYYQSAQYLRTLDFHTQLIGQGPILVDRYTATIWSMGSAHHETTCVANYRATGNPAVSAARSA